MIRGELCQAKSYSNAFCPQNTLASSIIHNVITVLAIERVHACGMTQCALLRAI